MDGTQALYTFDLNDPNASSNRPPPGQHLGIQQSCSFLEQEAVVYVGYKCMGLLCQINYSVSCACNDSLYRKQKQYTEQVHANKADHYPGCDLTVLNYESPSVPAQWLCLEHSCNKNSSWLVECMGL